MWINLLDNAVKYTPEGGEITVTLQVRPEELEISVADTGIGMPEEVRSHVFDKYYQGSRSSGSGRGLGLGLSIVYRILSCAAARSGWIAWWIRAAPSPSASPVPPAL